MAFSLPDDFAEQTNQLVSIFRDYETCAYDPDREKLLRQALLISCDLLNSISLDELSERIDEIYSDVEVYEKTEIKSTTWSEAMFEDPKHFQHFLDVVEDGILKANGLKKENRKRILQELGKLRRTALMQVGKLSSSVIISAIRSLRNDVCQLKDQQITAAHRKQAHTAILKSILVCAVAFNAVASVVFPSASPAAMAASIVLGGAAQFLPDQK